MARYRKRYPGVRFLLSLNGRLQDFPEFSAMDDIFTLDPEIVSRSDNRAHTSAVHAVADLFALACCNVVLATPVSSFSHFAANVLGPSSVALVPVGGASRATCLFATIELPHQRLNAWNVSCRSSLPAENQNELPEPIPPETNWLT